jgi:hypothetical protein
MCFFVYSSLLGVLCLFHWIVLSVFCVMCFFVYSSLLGVLCLFLWIVLFSFLCYVFFLFIRLCLVSCACFTGLSFLFSLTFILYIAGVTVLWHLLMVSDDAYAFYRTFLQLIVNYSRSGFVCQKLWNWYLLPFH